MAALGGRTWVANGTTRSAGVSVYELATAPSRGVRHVCERCTGYVPLSMLPRCFRIYSHWTSFAQFSEKSCLTKKMAARFATSNSLNLHIPVPIPQPLGGALPQFVVIDLMAMAFPYCRHALAFFLIRV